MKTLQQTVAKVVVFVHLYKSFAKKHCRLCVLKLARTSSTYYHSPKILFIFFSTTGNGPRSRMVPSGVKRMV